MSKTEEERPNVSYGNVELAQRNEILRTVVGSGVHGIAIEGFDDHDEMGIFVEPVENVVGMASRWTWRSTGPSRRGSAPSPATWT